MLYRIHTVPPRDPRDPTREMNDSLTVMTFGPLASSVRSKGDAQRGPAFTDINRATKVGMACRGIDVATAPTCCPLFGSGPEFEARQTYALVLPRHPDCPRSALIALLYHLLRKHSVGCNNGTEKLVSNILCNRSTVSNAAARGQSGFWVE